MEYLAITALTVSACLAVGMVMALLGSVKLALAHLPDRADSQIRALLTTLNLLLIPMILLAGLLVDRWGVRPMLLTGSLLLFASFLAMSFGLPYRRTLVMVTIAAVGASALYVSTMIQLTKGLFGNSEIAASFQLGMVFIALGGLVTLPLLDVLLHSIGFRRTMGLFSLFLLMPALLAWIPDSLNFPDRPNLDQFPLHLIDRRVILAGLVFFVYAPLEAFVTVWTVTYLTNLGQGDKQSRWLAAFWIAMIGSRFVFAVVLHLSGLYNQHTFLGWFLVVPALFSAVVLGNMSGTTRYDFAFFGLILLGVFMGPLYPMLLGLLFDREHSMEPQGSIFGLIYLFGSVGSLVLSPLVHFSAKRQSIQAAMRIPLFLALGLTAITLMFTLLQSAN